MNNIRIFSITLMASGFLILLPAQGLASVGRINFSYGPVIATDLNGESRSVRKGSELNQGDTIDTRSGRAHLKFNDGGYISLQPDTQFRIDEYKFDQNQEAEDRGIFSLIKGGLRALTGLIGKTDRKSYQLNTPMVTIGIRGTGYTAMVDDESATVSVGEGGIIMTNEQGTHVVNAWQAGKAMAGEAPGPSNQRPYLPPNAVPIYVPEYSIADERDPNGNPLILTAGSTQAPPTGPRPTLTPGPGYSMGFVFEDAVNGTTLSNIPTATVGLESSNIGLDDFDDGSVLDGNIGGASLVDFDTDGILGWGRWTSGFTGSTFPTGGEQDFHYIIGLSTPVMPTTGTATYTSYAYTTPTTTTVAPNTDGAFQNLSSTLAVDFGATTPTVDMDITLNYSNVTYALVPSGSAIISGNNFTGGAIFDGIDANGGSFSGFFSGTDASHAGAAYEFLTDDGNVTSGVVGYQKN